MELRTDQMFRVKCDARNTEAILIVKEIDEVRLPVHFMKLILANL